MDGRSFSKLVATTGFSSQCFGTELARAQTHLKYSSTDDVPFVTLIFTLAKKIKQKLVSQKKFNVNLHSSTQFGVFQSGLH